MYSGGREELGKTSFLWLLIFKKVIMNYIIVHILSVPKTFSKASFICQVENMIIENMIIIKTSHGHWSRVHGILQARILSGLPFTSPGDLPNSGIETRSPALQANCLLSEPPGKPNNNRNLKIKTKKQP